MGKQPRIRLAVLAAAVALAAAGGSAVGLGAPAWLAGAAAAVAALAAGMVVDRAYHARDDRGAAHERRRQVLDGLERAVGVDRLDVLGLLQADRSPVPFRGRGRELRQLADWSANESVSPVLLVSGPAGVGKSRLALEFGLRLPQDWAVGWLHAGTGADAIGAARACGEPTVILVDDADGRADLLPLLESLAEEHHGPVIRVVLVARSAIGLQAALMARLEERHTWIASGAAELDLGPEGGPEDWIRWFGEAVRAFAAVLDMLVPTLPDRFPRGQASAVQPFVVLQAQALLAVLSAGTDQPDPRDLVFGQVATALMSHEQRRWRAIAGTWDWGGGGPPSADVQQRSIAALALLGADGDAETEQVLRRVPELRDATAERLADIASWILALYPADSGSGPRIRPDMVGEWFVVSQLTAHPALTHRLQAGLSDEQAARALGLLARAADRMESASHLFAEFASGDIRRQVMAAALAARTGEAGRRLLDPVIAGQLRSAGGWTLDQLTELRDLLPEHVLLLTHVTIADLIVTMYRALAASDPAYQVGLAISLANLGSRFHQLGRYQEALDAAQEAVILHRFVAADNPAAHPMGLATALTDLGDDLDHVGRYQEALDAAQEAVALHRVMAADNPAAHQAGLAVALANLGKRFHQLVRYQEAVHAVQEAVALHRVMAADNPVHQASLASALTGLGDDLDHVGRYQEALDAVQEAVILYRVMAADNAAHRADLASALTGLGSRFHQLGRYQEALDAAQEAVLLYRVMAADNPAHRADLASALTGLGSRFHQLGRYQEALDAVQEAVLLHRVLAVGNAAYRAGLATALTDMGDDLDHVGRYHEALDAVQEALILHRALATDNPAHRADLAAALTNLSRTFHQLVHYQEAVEAAQEAITLYRALAADNPAHRAGLATALINVSHDLDHVGRHRAALDAQTESVSIYRELASKNPDLYQVEYRQSLGALRREYDLRGMWHEAMTHDLTNPTDRS